MAIDIGWSSTGSGYTSGPLTYLDMYNPANATGVLDTVVLRIGGTTAKTYVYGTMVLRSGTTYYARDFANFGVLGKGVRTMTGLSIDVATGDCNAVFHTGGGSGGLNFKNSGGTALKYPTSGGTGGDCISDQQDYDFNNNQNGYYICASGTGTETATGGGSLVGSGALVGGKILCGNSPLIN